MSYRQIFEAALPIRLASFVLVTACLQLSLAAQATHGTGPVAGTGIAPHAAAPAGRTAAPSNHGAAARIGPARSGQTRPSSSSNGAGYGNGPSDLSASGTLSGPSIIPPPGDYIAPPRTSYELPRDPHPTFEVPRYSGVQPYFQGNTNYVQNYGYGGLPYAYGGFPGFIDPGYISGYAGSDAGQQGPGQQGYDSNGGYADAGQGGPYAAEDGPAGRPPYYPANGQPAALPGPYSAGPYQRGPYQEPATVSNGPITDGLDHPEVTLIFNNGRPTEQVKSYALTRTTLFILDGEKRRQIPLSELDIPKTVQKNQEAGIDFTVPGR